MSHCFVLDGCFFCGGIFGGHGNARNTLQWSNISHPKALLKIIFLFPRWDMLVPRRVSIRFTYLEKRLSQSNIWRSIHRFATHQSLIKKACEEVWDDFCETVRCSWDPWYMLKLSLLRRKLNILLATNTSTWRRRWFNDFVFCRGGICWYVSHC